MHNALSTVVDHKAWTAAASRRCGLATLSSAFSSWSTFSHRASAIRTLTRRAAARKRRLALANGFRALSLSARRAAAAATVASTGGFNSGGEEGRGACQSDEEQRVTQAVKAAVEGNIALEGKVGRLRVRLAQERARALDRRGEAARVVEEIRRSELERARYAKKLRRPQGERALVGVAVAVGENGGTGDGERLRGAVGGRQRGVPETGATAEGGGEEGGEGAGGEGFFLEGYPDVGLSELTEREGELFGRLQADTLGMRQRLRAAEKAEEEVREEAARRATAMNAALEAALSEGRGFKKEAEAYEVCSHLVVGFVSPPPGRRAPLALDQRSITCSVPPRTHCQ